MTCPPIRPIPRAGRGGDQDLASIGRTSCHVPALQSGPSPFVARNNTASHPHSDFLLHGTGSLGDGIVQRGAGARELRTAPQRPVQWNTSG
jgi:CxxC motif-containing protein (DUF1111 family)